MNKLSIIAIILISLLSMNICQDSNVEFNSVNLKVLGQSGKIVLSKNFTTDNQTITEQVVIRFSSLTERDVMQNEVGQAGKVKHSFNNFAVLDFSVTNVTEQTYQNITVFQTSLKAVNIVQNASFTGSLLVFKEKGNITTGVNETEQVYPGALKFSVDIDNWVFCKKPENKTEPCIEPTCCSKGNEFEEGSYLDFALEIKGQKDANVTGINSYDLGNSKFVLSSYVNVDNVPTKLSEGFPKYEKQVVNDVFTFRFPKFEKNVSYDPLVVMKGIEDASKTSNTFLIVGIIVGIVSILVVVFLVLKCFKNGRKKDSLML